MYCGDVNSDININTVFMATRCLFDASCSKQNLVIVYVRSTGVYHTNRYTR